MGFNPDFPSQYNPLTPPTFLLVDDIGQYSAQSDTITNLGFRRHCVENIFCFIPEDTFHTSFNSPGWDNIANRNRGIDNLLGTLFSRDFLRGGRKCSSAEPTAATTSSSEMLKTTPSLHQSRETIFYGEDKEVTASMGPTESTCSLEILA